ncbi:MAG: thiol protease/hemagglutinin PrtT [Bacteroidetes bacterium]|nr:thiol protease/hemagglutinin PrtT [Bacteroidota bacterium]
MKKALLFFLGISFTLTSLFSKQIDVQTAKRVGQNYLAAGEKMQARRSTISLELVYTSSASFSNPNSSATPLTYFYVFNNQNLGFVIVSGDDNVIPILGYSNEISFDPNNIPPSVKKWLEGYKSQIREAIENNMQATQEIEMAWSIYLNGNNTNTPAAPAASVSPLMQTKWNQSPYYNALCPYDNQNSERTVTGCVATAMAQIMKFWNQPATGSGFHSYNHTKYGTLSANFGSTTYQWSSMPNVVNSNNNAVATLMYHCGISVDMNYDIASNGGSGAYVISSESPVTHCSEYAFKNYFGYKSSLQGVARKKYNESQWINLLKTELDAGRPILYAGFGSGGGHCFVADGYDNNNYFHFNWGWGGAYDGYYTINALNPQGVGTGGGSGGFNSGHQAVIKIEPTNTGGGGGGGSSNVDMRLYSNISMSTTSVWFTTAFSASVDIANFGPDNFNGEVGAAIFDKDYNFVDFMEKQSSSISSTYYRSFTFQNPGSAKFVPGTYYLAFFYKIGSADWTIIDDGAFNNLQQFEVEYSTDIEVNSAFTIVGDKIIQSKNANISVDIINAGSSIFYGDIRLDLSALDGSTAQTIQTLTETNGLPSGYHYTNGITFSGKVTLAPGTYLLSVAYKKKNTSSWYYAGSSNFQNPIYVIVEEPPLAPDQYENNNTKENAYLLNLSFSGNTAKVYTIGSNIHIGTDNDFYKINLPNGQDYTVNARLHDQSNSGNGNTYTVDALFSVSKDGTFWSDAYDDLMSSGIYMNDGGTFYFRVAPFFTGKTGTYLLDITVSKGNSVGYSELTAPDLISIFPNPAKDLLQIDLTKSTEQVSKIEIINIAGKIILTQNTFTDNNLVTISVQEIPDGMYFVKLYSQTGILTKKIIISK